MSYLRQAQKRTESKVPEHPRQEQKELMFKSLLLKMLADKIGESLQEAGFSNVEANEFFDTITEFPEDEILASLAVPHELQKRLFTAAAERIHRDKEQPKDFALRLREQAKKRGYALGFHVSNTDVQPQETMDDRGHAVEKWDIEGTEKDHRDTGLPRAYYSLDYQNLYRKKFGNYLYLVRAEVGSDSSHRRDNDGSWGRSSALSVVARLDLKETDAYIEKKLRDQSSNKK